MGQKEPAFDLFYQLPQSLVDAMKGMQPSTVLDKLASVQPMSQEAFDAYKRLAADKTWSFGKCKFIMRNSDVSQEESSTKEGKGS